MVATNHLKYNQILPENLQELASNHSDLYQEAKPFDHIALDDVFDERLLNIINDEFDKVDGEWKEFDTKYEKKLQFNNDEELGEYTRALIHQLNSAPFLKFLEELTGINGLIPDPYLIGGGLHSIPKGGKLGIHVDFNQYEKLNAYRRVNVLIYLNKDWKEEYGGHLELWNDLKGQEKIKILPIFNRMAIFSTTESSYHGHPKPLNCPENKCRRSLALYYYTAGMDSGITKKKHSTIFVDSNGKKEELGKIGIFKKSILKIKSKVKKFIS